MKLYEIKDKYVEALREVCELNDCTPDEAAGMLDKLDGEFEDKAIAIAATIKNLEAEIGAMEEYMDSMAKRVESTYNKSQWLRNYLKNNMSACHKNKIKSLELDVSIRNSKPSLYISSTAILHDQYWRTKTEKTIDKELLREHIEKGEIIDGVSLIPKTALFIS